MRVKYSIKFFELNRIALVLTLYSCFYFETAVLILTGSIRFAVVTMAVLIAALGIANSFVISFRGMALSAADLFSLGAAASVASEYTYELDWYMYMELLCTLAICMFSLKLHGGRILHPAVRAAVLVLWCGVAGSSIICAAGQIFWNSMISARRVLPTSCGIKITT